MLKFFFGGVERERQRFFRSAQNGEGTESKNEVSEELRKDGLDYIKISNEICEYDVLKFKKVYEGVLLGDALIVYSRKLDERNKSENNKFKVELMKLQMLGKMITGEDLNLLDKFEEKAEKKKKKVDESILLKAGFEII